MVAKWAILIALGPILFKTQMQLWDIRPILGHYFNVTIVPQVGEI
jgi:hypothetical protein